MSGNEIKAVVLGVPGPAGAGIEVVQLTLAEYEALSAEEQQDLTKLYYIID